MFEVRADANGRREMWRQVFESNFSPSPGGVLAFFGGYQSLTGFSASYDLVIRHYVVRDTNKCPYSGFIHVWPGVASGRDIPEEFRIAVGGDANEDCVSPETIARYLNTVQFVAVGSCDGHALVTQLEALSPHSSIFVHCAQLYRFADQPCAVRATTTSLQGLQMSMNVAEDVASVHGQCLVKKVLAIAKERESVVVLSFESSGFGEDKLPESLASEKEFAVLNIAMSETQAKLRAALRYCLDHLNDMSVDEALARIGECGESHLNSAICSATILSAKSLHHQAWETVETVYSELLESHGVSHLLLGAQLAYAVGRHEEAAALLNKVDEAGPTDLETLATLHTLRDMLGHDRDARRILARLSEEFPGSPVTKAKRLKLAMLDRDFDTAKGLAADIGDAYIAELCGLLSSEKLRVKPFLDFSRSVGRENRAFRDLATEANRRGRYGAAWRFLRKCTPCGTIVALQCEVLAKRVIRRGAINDSFVNNLRSIMAYVSANPGDMEARFALQGLLEDDLEDYTSMILLAVLMDREATLLHESAMHTKATDECRWIVDQDFETNPSDDSYLMLMKLMESLPRVTTLVGDGELPSALKSVVTHKMLHDWVYLLQHDQSWSVDKDQSTRLLLLHVIMLLARHLNDPTTDFLAIRYGILARCLAGRLQDARDLAETALMVLPSSQPNFRRWRLAFGWLCHAEAFQRSSNPHAALSTLCLALLAASNQSIPSMKGVKEVFRLCSRIARDIRILPLAVKYIGFERDLMQSHKIEMDTEYQLAQLEHSIKALACLGAGTAEEIEELVREGCKFVEQEYDSQPEPMLSTLAILLVQLKQRKKEVDPVYEKVFRKHVEQVRPDIKDLLLSQIDSSPTIARLQQLARRAGHANSLNDLAFQGTPLRILAERAVAHSQERRDPVLFLTAASILSQPILTLSILRGSVREDTMDSNTINEWLYGHIADNNRSPEQMADVSRLSQLANRTARSSFESVLDVTPASIVAHLNDDEIVTVLSRDSQGNLYQLQLAKKGTGEVRLLSPDVWSPSLYSAWRKKYPAAYGEWSPSSDPLEHDTPTTEEIRDTVHGLSMDGWARDIANIIVPDSELFGFPFGLSLHEKQFVGSRYQTACTPSLQWFLRARTTPPDLDGRKVAWMGTPGKRDWGLEQLDSKIMKSLTEANVHPSTAESPSGFHNVSLGIVAAHGGVGPFGQFVSITADRKRRFTPDEFAECFENCGCLVLLICSAGRSDERLHTSETRGLVSALLERGVRSIIAPVWPLAIAVAAIWLPVFLDQITKGICVGAAAFSATREAERIFPNPCAWAGLQVYGDYLLRLPVSNSL